MKNALDILKEAVEWEIRTVGKVFNNDTYRTDSTVWCHTTNTIYRKEKQILLDIKKDVYT